MKHLSFLNIEISELLADFILVKTICGKYVKLDEIDNNERVECIECTFIDAGIKNIVYDYKKKKPC